MKFKVIGLTGKNAAGKGTVAKFLMANGYDYYSLSDILRDELRNLNRKETRENLIEIGNHLRKEEGPGVLANKLISKLSLGRNYIVDSVRNPSEVESFRQKLLAHDFFLISVDADARVRYERLCSRGRSGDTDSWEIFINQERLEENSDNPNKQQLSNTMSLANFKIDNSGNLKDLEIQLQGLISQL